MLTMQALVSCDEFGCVAHEPVTLKVFHGEIRAMTRGNGGDSVPLTQFELVENPNTQSWVVNFSGDKSYCPEHVSGWTGIFSVDLSYCPEHKPGS